MFGRSKNKKGQNQQPQQMQMSPETLALLQAMQAGQQMQQMQQQMQQQMMMQQMQQPQAMPPQQPVGQQPQMMPQQPMMAPQQMTQQPQMAPQQQMPVMDDQALLAEIGGPANQADPMQAMQQAPIMQPEMPQQQMPMQPMAGQQTAVPAETEPFAQEQSSDQLGVDSFNFAAQQAPLAAEDEQEKPKKKGKLTKEEKRALASQKKAEKEKKKAEKKALASEKAEEKKRAKRRKKLAKTRFSRARYLREANGNALAGVILWIFVIILFIAGPFMLNTAILIPQTNENLRILSELDQLEQSIVRNRPQITAMVERRKSKRGQITAFTAGFPPKSAAEQSLQSLAQQLEEAGLEIQPLTIAPFPLGAQSIIGTSVTVEIIGNYLDWLRIRNKFVRSQRAISIPNETVEINSETGQMEITAQIILPSSF